MGIDKGGEAGRCQIEGVTGFCRQHLQLIDVDVGDLLVGTRLEELPRDD